MERLGIVSISDVIPLINSEKIANVHREKLDGKKKFVKKQRVEINGYMVGINSLRLATFKTKGLKCVKCGVVGQYFAIERKNDSNHLNLYARYDGEEILMTHDHIKPKSKGGNNNLNNTQTMCIVCNREKADKY